MADSVQTECRYFLTKKLSEYLHGIFLVIGKPFGFMIRFISLMKCRTFGKLIMPIFLNILFEKVIIGWLYYHQYLVKILPSIEEFGDKMFTQNALTFSFKLYVMWVIPEIELSVDKNT